MLKQKRVLRRRSPSGSSAVLFQRIFPSSHHARYSYSSQLDRLEYYVLLNEENSSVGLKKHRSIVTFESRQQRMTLNKQLNFYEILGLKKELKPSEIDIKSSYRRLALKFHPDKQPSSLSRADLIEAEEKFKDINKAYSILSDPKKKQLYDTTGSVEDDFNITNDANWTAYFDKVVTRVSKEELDRYRQKYLNSPEERQDIEDAYHKCRGDLTLMIELIPFSSFEQEDMERIVQAVTRMIDDKQLTKTRSWTKTSKIDDRKRKSLLKRSAKEAEEAEQLAKDLGIERVSGEDQLKQLIQSKNKNNFDALMDGIEKRYTKKSKK